MIFSWRRSLIRSVFSLLAASTCGIDSLHAQDIPPEFHSSEVPANGVWIDSLDLSLAEQGYGKIRAGHSVDGHSLTLKGMVYPHGVGTHAIGRLAIDLHGEATHFQAVVGLDDETAGSGSVTFAVYLDGKKVASVSAHGGRPPQVLQTDLTGGKKMILFVDDGGDGNTSDHADWAGAFITQVPEAKQKPETVALANAPRLKMVPEDPQPAIHGARIVGATPGRSFLFPVPATGTQPLTYAAENLPEGLQLDPQTGIISGMLRQAGTTQTMLSVHGPGGTARRQLTIVGGDNKLALTPPMGWNSWNVWADKVDESKVKDAGHEMISTGLVRHGYQYVNIDDTWQGKRNGQGILLGNEKFPDMKALCDDLHRQGLKAGIYSSPGPKTCAGYAGSYHHEDQDAQTYADWGFDYLKYDVCSYRDIIGSNPAVEAQEKPYQVMADSLAKVHRDILYSLCQYGWGEVWKWGAHPDIRGNCWRTHDDISELWTGAEYWGHDRGVYDIIEAENGHEKYAGPGHWNDPDMLMVGMVGFGNPHPTRLTPNEQLVHVSMWCLFSAPLLIGCDMTKLDPFTLAILTNDEVLDIDQDPLGKPAGRVAKDAMGGEVWSRELFDGTRGVGLLNASPVEETVTVHWSDIGLSGRQPVRDLWLHEDVGSFSDSYSVVIPSHGIALLKIGTSVQ